jgi:voltage-gated potassium channel
MEFKGSKKAIGTLRRKFLLSLLLIFLVISGGTVGYMLIEGWNFIDSIYMTVITLSTVGFQEVHDVSTNGRIFTVILIIGGAGTLAYTLSAGVRMILEGELLEIFGRKRLEKIIKDLEDHYIICGYGRMGKIICKELKNGNKDFVVIEREIESLDVKEDILVLKGDATSDETLKEAGIERAKGLISVLPTDAENLYVVLSARGLNRNLFIVARAGEEGSVQKLMRAGSDEVVSPYYIGGLRIAHKVLKPAVVDFIDFTTKSSNIELQMEEIRVRESSKLAGLSLNECGFGRDLGIIIVAIQSAEGKMLFNPTYRSEVKAGDTLIAVGEVSSLKKLEDMAVEETV